MGVGVLHHEMKNFLLMMAVGGSASYNRRDGFRPSNFVPLPILAVKGSMEGKWLQM